MRTSAAIAVLTLALAQEAAFAQAPGAGASPDERLDYLLESWRGRSHEELRKVWGRETAVRTRGPNPTYLYEHHVRVRGAPLTGQISIATDGLVCTAWFEVDIRGTIVRTARQGGGRECWRGFRNRTPPDPARASN